MWYSTPYLGMYRCSDGGSTRRDSSHVQLTAVNGLIGAKEERNGGLHKPSFILFAGYRPARTSPGLA